MLFIKYVLSDVAKSEKLKLLNLFGDLEDQAIRFSVYVKMTERSKEEINWFVSMLRESSKNFDDDITKIVQEAKRIGISIQEFKIQTIDY